MSLKVKAGVDYAPELEEIVGNSQESSPLGLKLTKIPSLINLLEKKLSQTRKSADQEVSQAKVDSEKLKASNFLATSLKIGNWESLSRNEGGLIAKCYYAKKKIVWEILDGSLKSKIELHWFAIVGIKAVLRDNESEILEIEVDNEFVGIKVVLRDNQSLPALYMELPACVNLWINITVEGVAVLGVFPLGNVGSLVGMALPGVSPVSGTYVMSHTPVRSATLQQVLITPSLQQHAALLWFKK